MSRDGTFDHERDGVPDPREAGSASLSRGPDPRTRPTGRTSTAALDLDAVFDVLDDEDCRAFLDALEESLTAAELSERCDVPSSTTYRKLDRLSEVGLVTSTLEICGTNNHQARYHRTITSFTFEFDGGRFSVEAEPGEP